MIDELAGHAGVSYRSEIGGKRGPYVGHAPARGNHARGAAPLAGNFVPKPLPDRPHLLVVADGELNEIGLGRGCGRQLDAGVEAFVEQVLGAVGIGLEAARHQLARLAAELVLALAHRRDGGEQRPARTRMDHRLAVALELVPVEAIHADAEIDPGRADAEPEAGRLPGLAVAGPEPEVEMVLVGPLVLGKADVAVDALDRAVDLRLEADVGRDRLELGAEGLDEGARRRDIAGLVERPVGLEPGLFVVGRDALEEGEGRFGKAGKVGHDALGSGARSMAHKRAAREDPRRLLCRPRWGQSYIT